MLSSSRSSGCWRHSGSEPDARQGCGASGRGGRHHPDDRQRAARFRNLLRARFYAPDLPTLGISRRATPRLSLERPGKCRHVHQERLQLRSRRDTAPGRLAVNGPPPGLTAPGYVVVGDPLDPSFVPRFFESNADGVIYEHGTTLNGVMPEFGAPPRAHPSSKESLPGGVLSLPGYSPGGSGCTGAPARCDCDRGPAGRCNDGHRSDDYQSQTAVRFRDR